MIVVMFPSMALAARRAPSARRMVPSARTAPSSAQSVSDQTRNSAKSGARVHRVRRGETLSEIARRYSVSVPSIVAANRLPNESMQLRPGSRLAIPLSATSGAVAGPRIRRIARVATVPQNLVLAVPEFAEVSPGFLWPVDGTISSPFGYRADGWHRGIDIMAPPGALVFAAATGIVIVSGVEVRYGRVVKIEHDNGFVTVYAHNDENLVEAGDQVAAGQTIATVGRTGHATSEHVHFEIRREGRAYNPLYLLPLPSRGFPIENGDRVLADADE
jgi:murein DD-endopeptidase MepM/ murein hydrolase activator NlpD